MKMQGIQFLKSPISADGDFTERNELLRDG
jgi:hypothetical protein